jgi:hypothetical protein
MTGPLKEIFAMEVPNVTLDGTTTAHRIVRAWIQTRLGTVQCALAKSSGDRCLPIRSDFSDSNRYNNDVVVEDFVWMNTSYRYKVFDSPSWLIDQTPTYTLMLQTFFDCTSSYKDLQNVTVLKQIQTTQRKHLKNRVQRIRVS